MSRGHGNIQQFILDGLNQMPDPGTGALPIPWLAYVYAGWKGIEDTHHLRSSMRRAINRLEAEGRVGMYEYLLPSYGGPRPSDRWTLCVARRDTTWTEDTYEFALGRMEWLFEAKEEDRRQMLRVMALATGKEAMQEGDQEKLAIAKMLARLSAADPES